MEIFVTVDYDCFIGLKIILLHICNIIKGVNFNEQNNNIRY